MLPAGGWAGPPCCTPRRPAVSKGSSAAVCRPALRLPQSRRVCPTQPLPALRAPRRGLPACAASPRCVLHARSERHLAREFQTIDQMASFIENLPEYSHQQVGWVPLRACVCLRGEAVRQRWEAPACQCLALAPPTPRTPAPSRLPSTRRALRTSTSR